MIPADMQSVRELIQLLLDEVSALKFRVEALEAGNPLPEWVPASSAASIINRCPKTLRLWTKTPDLGLVEDVHWRKNGRAVEYNHASLAHWVSHRERG